MFSVNLVSYNPFVWSFQSILLIINPNSGACANLEALDVGTARGVVMRWA